MSHHLIERKRQERAQVAGVVSIVAALALGISLVIVTTLVSIGFVRADSLDLPGGLGRLPIVLGLGIAIAAVGGLTAAAVRGGKPPQRHE